MDAAPLIDPQCTRLRIDGRRGLVTDLDQLREHTIIEIRGYPDVVIDPGQNERTILPNRDGWKALGECIGRHENLQRLEFGGINSTPENLQALLMGVSHNRSVKKLEFHDFHGHWPLEILATFFENNRNLSSLEVRNGTLSHESVRSLSTVFGSCAACSLEEIRLNRSSAGDAIMQSEFIGSLASLSQLKNLCLRSCYIGRRGCDAVAVLLRNPSCTLQKIDLSVNRIGDVGLAALETAVAMNGTLKCLILADIGDITPAAWISFANILRNPACILEELYLNKNIINDNVMVAFADALSGNNTLKGIWWFSHRSSISNIGWTALSRSLFNESSFIDMYRCNHTLKRIGGHTLQSDLISYLQLNRDDDKRAVARQKILMRFFKCNFDMEPFDENNMDSKVLPHLLSWMGRLTDRQSYTALFGFLRRAPTLCENAASRHNTTAPGSGRLRGKISFVKAED